MVSRAMVVVGWLAASAASVAVAEAQSLADVARAEEARRKAVRSGSKVYTNDDLQPDFTRPVPPPAPAASPSATDSPAPASVAEGAPAAASPDQPAGAAAADAPDMRDQAYWSNRIGQARSQLERSRAFLQAMQNRVDMLWTDFVNRDDPVQRGNIEKERLAAIEELERLKQEVADNERAITAVEDEARRAGVPAGWLRPS